MLVLPGVLGTPFAGWSKAKTALDKAVVDARIKAAAAGTGPTPISGHLRRRCNGLGPRALRRPGVRCRRGARWQHRALARAPVSPTAALGIVCLLSRLPAGVNDP
jgi:hypothetical protein